jgi:hypothetical protein
MSIVSSLGNLVDINYFNNLLVKGGGDPILTKKKIVKMRHFITILLKLFKKNYDLTMKKSSRNKTSRSSRSGGADLGPYTSATFYSDLNYSNPYTFPPAAVTQRSFI